MKLLDFSNPKVQEDYLTSLYVQEPNISIDFTDPQAVTSIKEMRLAAAALDELNHLLAEGRVSLDKVRSPLSLSIAGAIELPFRRARRRYSGSQQQRTQNRCVGSNVLTM